MTRRQRRGPFAHRYAWRHAWALAAALLLAAAASLAEAAPPIQWTQEAIIHSIGAGTSADDSFEVAFVSDRPLADVAVWVTPGIRPFLRLDSPSFSSIEPGLRYELRGRFVVPPRAAPGVYDGTIHLRVGPRTISRPLAVTVQLDYGTNRVQPTTRVVSDTSAVLIDGISDDGSTIVFAGVPPELGDVRAGDVVVFGVTPWTPLGLLRRVDASVVSGDTLTLLTSPATLEDVFEEAALSLTRRLLPADVQQAVAQRQGVALRFPDTPRAAEELTEFFVEIEDVVLYDDDGNLGTDDDQIQADGSLSLAPYVEFSFAVEDFRLTRLQFVTGLVQRAEITVHSRAEILGIQRKHELGRYPFTPITVWVSWVPVVIAPVLTVNVGIDGSVYVGVEAGIDETAEARAGASYDNGTWSPIGDISIELDASPPRLSAGLEVKAFAGPQLNLLLYGVVGPYLTARGFLDLEADLFATPWWSLYGGFEATAGVHVDVLGRSIVDHELPGVIGIRRLIAQATEPPTRGSVEGLVRDAVSRAPIAGVSVAAYRDATQIGLEWTDASGRFRMDLPTGSGYRFVFSKPTYLPAEHHGIDVQAGVTSFLEPILQIDVRFSGAGDAGGVIRDALSGSGVSGVTLELRTGINVRTGPVVASTVTGVTGAYLFEGVAAGNYTAEASAPGYNSSWFSVLVIGSASTGGQDAVITPRLAESETRIVLTWGLSPSDLDSHLTGPLPGGQRFHLYYPYADANGGSPWPDHVRLDRDDVTSYGPETVTILQQVPGTYRYSVHDYTNRASQVSAALSASGAQVRVYRGSALVAVFNAPAATPGTLWTVFELEGDVIVPLNRMSFESAPSAIMRMLPISDAPNDGHLLTGLPEKR